MVAGAGPEKRRLVCRVLRFGRATAAVSPSTSPHPLLASFRIERFSSHQTVERIPPVVPDRVSEEKEDEGAATSGLATFTESREFSKSYPV